MCDDFYFYLSTGPSRCVSVIWWSSSREIGGDICFDLLLLYNLEAGVQAAAGGPAGGGAVVRPDPPAYWAW